MGLERSSFSPELVPAGTDRVLQILCKKNTIAWVSTYMIQKISGSIYYVPRVVAFPNCFFGIWCWVFVYLWGILLLFFLVLLLLCWGVGVFCFGVCVCVFVCSIYLPSLLRTRCFPAVDVLCVGSADSCYSVSARTPRQAAGLSALPFLSLLFPCITVVVRLSESFERRKLMVLAD